MVQYSFSLERDTCLGAHFFRNASVRKWTLTDSASIWIYLRDRTKLSRLKSATKRVRYGESEFGCSFGRSLGKAFNSCKILPWKLLSVQSSKRITMPTLIFKRWMRYGEDWINWLNLIDHTAFISLRRKCQRNQKISLASWVSDHSNATWAFCKKMAACKLADVDFGRRWWKRSKAIVGIRKKRKLWKLQS